MDLDKTLGRLALAVPVAHVATCTLFLFGYSWGFGSGVGTLFAVSDFFTISLDYLVRVYALGLGLPLITVAYRHRVGRPYAADMIATETDEIRRDQLIRQRQQVKFIMLWGSLLIAFLALTLLILSVSFDLNRDYYIMVSFIVFSLAIPFWWLCDRMKFYGFAAEIVWVIICLVTGVIGIGMDAGFRDRRFPYQSVATDTYRCGEYAILTPLGDRFLAVTKENVRYVIDDQCKGIFSFPNVKPIRNISIATAVSKSVAD